MSRYYKSSNDGTGCGCAVMTIYIVISFIGMFTETYNRINNIGKLYMIASVAVCVCLGIAIYYWIESNKSKKESIDANLRIQQKCIENNELKKKNRQLELSKQSAWDMLEKERKELLLAHNRQEADFKNRKAQLELQYKRLEENCNNRTTNKIEQLEEEYKHRNNQLEQERERMMSAVKSSTPFNHVATMYTDLEMCVFKNTERWMINKKNPARTSAEMIKEFKNKSREYISLYKQMEYKYLFLLDAFPELKLYVDDEESLTHLADYKDYDEFREKSDEVLEYMNIEEYKKLSVTERNQLALDRYKQRKKSNWVIGMEYEMYIDYKLRECRFHTIQYGIQNGLNDLGRDIIAERAHLDGSRTIYIIQCKRWSENRQLHENVVCQLFGTKIEYEIQHQHFMNTKIIPVLVTTTDLSETAEKFARKLDVLVKKVPMGEYPMIKCNINGDNRIYHLPFDQQYYRTQITKPGESYAWTVEEAESKGFRRARRHLI